MVLDANERAQQLWKAAGYAPDPQWTRWIKPLTQTGRLFPRRGPPLLREAGRRTSSPWPHPTRHVPGILAVTAWPASPQPRWRLSHSLSGRHLARQMPSRYATRTRGGTRHGQTCAYGLRACRPECDG
jgi:hypothetical protein